MGKLSKLKEERVKIEKMKAKLEKRYQELFNSCVSLLQKGEKERAEIYAAEAAFVKKILKELSKLLSMLDKLLAATQ